MNTKLKLVTLLFTFFLFNYFSGAKANDLSSHLNNSQIQSIKRERDHLFILAGLSNAFIKNKLPL